jgi:N-acetylglucosaminyl-diphospho-decaprenol L-rhamnosyltransferase
MDNTPDLVPPRVGVVTVSFGSQLVLPPFLSSLREATSREASIVIADNRPSPEIAALAREHGAAYVELPDNPGYGAAMNRAIAELDRSIEWVLISNPDVVLEPESLDRLLEAGREDVAIASVGPAILTATGDVYPSARRVPSLRTGVGHALFYNLWPNNVWSRAYLSELNTEPRDAGWLSGACLLVRRTAFDEIGGFDDGYFMYFEDVDLGDRLAKAGYRNVYRPQARVTHSGAHSTTESSERMLKAHHASASRFLSRKYSGPLLWPVRVVLRIGLGVRSAVEGRRARYRGDST